MMRFPLARLREDCPFYDLFEDGLVPVTNEKPVPMRFEDSDERLGFYVAQSVLPDEKLHEISQRIADLMDDRADRVFSDIKETGLPIRESQVVDVRHRPGVVIDIYLHPLPSKGGVTTN